MRMKRDWERLAPPGIGEEAEIKWILSGMALSLLYSLRFLLAYFSAREALFEWVGRDKLLIPGAMMPDFAQLLDGSLIGFGILMLCMVPLAVYHYAYHFQGSRSVYLMRRLPRRSELHRRCLALPALAALACALAAAALLLAYFGLYRAATPQVCLPPLQKIFTAWTGALT
jgi:hypothetical protein